MQVVFCDKLSWFVSEVPEKDTSDVVVQLKKYPTICFLVCF